MKDWQLVTDGTAKQLAGLLGLPDRVGHQIMADTVHSFRGYAMGLTIVGLLSGAVVALGAKGLSVALAMLAITLLANNTLQNLLEPVAFGRTLRLHPLVVLLVTIDPRSTMPKSPGTDDERWCWAPAPSTR